MYVIIILTLMLKISANMGMKSTPIVKLENVKLTNINTKLMECESNVVPINATLNYLNQTLKFKFNVVDDIVVDISVFRIIRNNRTFKFTQFSVNLKTTLTMDAYGMAALWRDCTRPQFTWPPQKNVIYRTFGWTTDVSNIYNIPAGLFKFSETARLRNRTKLSDSVYFLSVTY